jgi:hypothetical protein
MRRGTPRRPLLLPTVILLVPFVRVAVGLVVVVVVVVSLSPPLPPLLLLVHMGEMSSDTACAKLLELSLLEYEDLMILLFATM